MVKLFYDKRFVFVLLFMNVCICSLFRKASFFSDKTQKFLGRGIPIPNLKSQLEYAVYIDTNQRQKAQVSQNKKRDIFVAF